MKDRSTMNIVEFLVNVAWKYVIGFIWYKNLLFRVIPHRDVYESYHALFLMMLISIFICVIMMRYRKNGWTATICVIFPFGLYTVLTYAVTYAFLIKLVMSVSVLLSFAYSYILLKRSSRDRSEDAQGQRFRKQIIKCIYSVSYIMAAAMLVLMIGIGWRGYFGSGQIASSVKAEGTNKDIKDEDTMEANKDTVLKLWPSEWEKLNTHERINVLQTVCNIETHYLGLSDPVSVLGDNLSPTTLGAYSDPQKVILINLNHIENDNVKDVLSTLLHEIHHSYEQRLAEVIANIPSEYHDLRLFKDASYYSQESDHYINPRKDYCGYMSQHLEMDCETYAELGVDEYYTRIEKWLGMDGTYCMEVPD